MRFWLIALLAVTTLFGKDLSNWDAVTGLSKGNSVQVVRKGGEAATGKVTASTASSVTLETKSGELTVARPEIATVGVKKPGRAKWIGVAAGAVGGIAGGAALGTRLANEGAANKEGITAGGAAAGALIGWAVGASIDSGYKTIYRGN